jgi:hydrogenase maturation protease
MAPGGTAGSNVAPARALVIGYGNPLRGDDGVGPEVARLVMRQRSRTPALAATRVVWGQQLVPEMAQELSEVGFAVFVDAVSDQGPAGLVSARRLLAPSATGARGAVAVSCWEDLGPAALLAMARQLYGWAPPAVLVSIAAPLTELGTGLSPAVRTAVPRAAAAVRMAIAAGASPRPLGWGRGPISKGRAKSA